MNPKKIARKILPKKLTTLSEESYRKGRLILSSASHGFPARNLKVIAVTGTNGKTSTCCYLNDVLRHAGYKTALFTTAVIELDGQRELNTSHRTVPLTSELYGFLRKAKQANVDYVILETTSHALHQHKVWGIPIEVAVMTNLSQDHLDYHGTMEKYAKSKAKLFNAYMNPKNCVLNADDEWFEFFKAESVGHCITYGTGTGTDIRLTSILESQSGLQLTVQIGKERFTSQCPVLGVFNAYNLAAVTSVAHCIGMSSDSIQAGLEHVQGVPGRMEMINSKRGFSVVVDYAHTPDALEKAIKALKAVAKGKVRVVFGATGNRDTSKRPIMGEVAAYNADYIYLTDDETYTEDAASIRQAVYTGISKAGGAGKTQEIGDRKAAIMQAISDAGKGDMILVAGLGHQNYRAMQEGNIAWQEAEIVKELLQ